MVLPTPFHARTAPRCTSFLWREWAGHASVRRYGACHEPEYFALRNACGLIDVSPLYKYAVHGPDAAAFLSFALCRDVARSKVGRVTYVTWCDERGKVLDDGTVLRLERERFRVTSAEPSLAWFQRLARGFRVTVQDATTAIAALAIQGPTSRAVLDDATGGAVADLPFFGFTRAALDGRHVEITRTGYTGDLGYEVWLDPKDALPVYDALLHHGRDRGLVPAGLDALDMTRVEAGFILQGVDYVSARHALTAAQTSTPFELDLGWTVHLDREPFVGQAALREEKERGSARTLVGLATDGGQIEELFLGYGLPPGIPAEAWRDGRPVYLERRRGARQRQVGRATSGAWSPLLKQFVALATVDRAYAAAGTTLRLEITVEYERRSVDAVVVPRPFFDPERKRA